VNKDHDYNSKLTRTILVLCKRINFPADKNNLVELITRPDTTRPAGQPHSSTTQQQMAFSIENRKTLGGRDTALQDPTGGLQRFNAPGRWRGSRWICTYK